MNNPVRKTIFLSIFIIGGTLLSTFLSYSLQVVSFYPPEKKTAADSVFRFGTFKLPDSISFAGESMPLENIDTRESLDREVLITAFRHSSTILIIKRANRYMPLIEKILKKNHIPDDFKYLAVAESDLSNVISPAGAVGFWQIMDDTGREGGLEINKVVDERYDVEKSTQFACEYFQKSYEKYGNWTMAAASYDNGRGGVDDQIAIQHKNNYYDLLLNEETARYIFRAIAYKMILSDPGKYMFFIGKEDLYPEFNYTEVKADTAISDFAAYAEKFGTNYKMIKMLNPWLRKPFLTLSPGREYLIKIPSSGMRHSENR